MTTPYVDAFMLEALCEARLALAEGEVAVGCVLVHVDDNARAHDAAVTTSAAACVDATLPQAPQQYIAARGRNATNAQHHALAHAEFMAVEALLARVHDSHVASDAKSNGDGHTTRLRDLSSYVLYVTCEPCIMCAALLLYNRIGHVFYGCCNDRFGGNGSILALHDVHRNRFAASANSDGVPCALNNDDDDNDDKMTTRTRGEGAWGYASEGGHRAAEAVALLQTFYRRENPHAPGHKRRRKPTAA